jgi:hypothetical protein
METLTKSRLLINVNGKGENLTFIGPLLASIGNFAKGIVKTHELSSDGLVFTVFDQLKFPPQKEGRLT